MPTSLKIPLSALMVAAIGCAVCMLAGFAIHTRELLSAGAVAILAGELALVPMLITRHANQAAVAQAALVATIVHLFGCVLALAAILLGRISVDAAFTYWLMAMYFVTLIALASGLVRQVKTAPTALAAAPAKQ